MRKILLTVLMISFLLMPVASAGPIADIISEIQYYINGDAGVEIVYPAYSSYTGTLLNPSDSWKSADPSGGSDANPDYATFPADTYGKIVYINTNDPITKEYQETGNGLVVYVGVIPNESCNIKVRIYSDNGDIVNEVSRTCTKPPLGIMVYQTYSFGHPVSYYDTDGDGQVRIEVEHDNGPEIGIALIKLQNQIDVSIPEPTEETEEDTEDSASSGDVEDSQNSVVDEIINSISDDGNSDSTTDETVTESNTLFNPMYTVKLPGFEAVFAMFGLFVVAWMVRRNK